MKIKQFLMAAAALVLAVSCGPDPVEPTPQPEVQVAVLPMEVSFAPAGGEQTVSVTAKAAWTATPSAEWITVEPASGEAGTVSVKIVAAKNAVAEAREGKVVFAVGEQNAEVAVAQQAGIPAGNDNWGLVGDFKDANLPSWDPKQPINLTWDGEYYALMNYNLNANATFKFVKDGPTTEWATNRGYNGDKPIQANYYYAVEGNGGNIMVTEAGAYDIYLNADATVFYLMAAGTAPADAQDSETIEVAPFVPEGLFIVGSATDFGWDANGSNEAAWMTRGRNGSFTWTGNLKSGEGNTFKFMWEPGNWEPRYTRDADAEEYWTLKYQPAGGTDDQFQVAEDGVYTIELNVLDLTISCTKQEAPAYTPWDLNSFGFTSFKGKTVGNVTEISCDTDNGMIWLKLNHEGEFATADGVWYDADKALYDEDTDNDQRTLHGYITDYGTYEWATVAGGNICLSTTDVDGVYSLLIPEGNPLILEGYMGNYSISGEYTVSIDASISLEFWINPDAGLDGQMLMCESTMSMGLPGHYFAMQDATGNFAMITLLDLTDMENYQYPTSDMYPLMTEPMPGQKGVLVGYEQFGYFTIGGINYYPYMPEVATDENGRPYGVEVWNGLEMGMDILYLDFNLPVFNPIDNSEYILTGCYQGPAGFGVAPAKQTNPFDPTQWGFKEFTANLEGNIAVLTSRSYNGTFQFEISNWGEPFASEEGVLYYAGDNLLNAVFLQDDGFEFAEYTLDPNCGGWMKLYTTEAPNYYKVEFASNNTLKLVGDKQDLELVEQDGNDIIGIEGLMAPAAGEGDVIDSVMGFPYGGGNYVLYCYCGPYLIQLDVWNDSEEEINIAAGSFTVTDVATFDGTNHLVAGTEARNNADGAGTYVYDATTFDVVGYVTEGSMNLVDNGDGNWSLSIDFKYDNGETFQNEFTGAIEFSYM